MVGCGESGGFRAGWFLKGGFEWWFLVVVVVDAEVKRGSFWKGKRLEVDGIDAGEIGSLWKTLELMEHAWNLVERGTILAGWLERVGSMERVSVKRRERGEHGNQWTESSLMELLFWQVGKGSRSEVRTAGHQDR